MRLAVAAVKQLLRDVNARTGGQRRPSPSVETRVLNIAPPEAPRRRPIGFVNPDEKKRS
jgi:hypothetical protein